MSNSTDNPISNFIHGYQKYVPNAAVQALLVGGGLYAASRAAWGPVVETLRSMARVPGRKLGGLTDAEWDEAMDELKANKKYKRWVPAIVGALTATAATAPFVDPTREHYGLLNWNAGVAPRMHKGANSELFQYGGYVPDLDFTKPVNARSAATLFTNDPWLQNQQYAKNISTSIVTGAALDAGTANPTIGNIFDTAVKKIDNKLNFEGLTSLGVRSVISNGMARLFTGALDTMVDLKPETKRNLIDAGTWAGVITGIFNN